MDQFSQTNDLQQAISNAANNADTNAVKDQFGVPPVPPMPPVGSAPAPAMDELPPIAPVDPMPIAPPMPKEPVSEMSSEASASATQTFEPQPLVPPEPRVEEPAKAPVEPVAEAPTVEVKTETMAEAPVEGVEEEPVGEKTAEEPKAETEEPGDLAETKENILKDLMPLMDRVEMSAEEKYAIYKEAMETSHDKSIIPKAYRAATKIEDENEKAEALIALMRAIDMV